MVGYNQEIKYICGFLVSWDEFIFNDFFLMDVVIGEKYVGNLDDSWVIRSGFFCVNYSFVDCYLLEVNGCYDLLFKFLKDDCFVFSFFFFLGWKLLEESWFK